MIFIFACIYLQNRSPASINVHDLLPTSISLQDLSSHEECLELLNKSVRALTLVSPNSTNSDTTANDTMTPSPVDTTATQCPNGKTPCKQRSRKRSRTSNESCSGHDDKLHHSYKCTPIISKEFDRTHVQWLRKCSLKEYLCESVAIHEHADKPRDCLPSVQDAACSKLAGPANVQTDTADDTSVGKQKKCTSEAGDGDSCDSSDSGDEGRSVTTIDLVDCIVHPDVIALICQKLTHRMGAMRAKPSS